MAVCAELGFGITSASRPDHVILGAELERLGYAEVWVNDTRRGDGVTALAELSAGTSRIGLAIGVVALSEHSPPAIRARLARLDTPPARLTLGVGAGASASLALVRDGVTELRSLLPGVPIAVAAVGPRMLGLAGEVADAVVATWALPERVPWIRERIAEGAALAGRKPPRLVLYLRTAVGAGARDRLRREMDRYAAYGRHYARAFDAQSDRLVGVAVESGDPRALAAALAPYRSQVDTLVIRGLPTDDTVAAWSELASVTRAAWAEGWSATA